MFAVDPDGKLYVYGAGESFVPREGWTVIVLGDPIGELEPAHDGTRASGRPGTRGGHGLSTRWTGRRRRARPVTSCRDPSRPGSGSPRLDDAAGTEEGPVRQAPPGALHALDDLALGVGRVRPHPAISTHLPFSSSL